MIRRWIAHQFARPSGRLGRWFIAPWLNRIGRRLNRLAFDLLAPKPGEALLEIGFGGGALLERLAAARPAKLWAWIGRARSSRVGAATAARRDRRSRSDEPAVRRRQFRRTGFGFGAAFLARSRPAAARDGAGVAALGAAGAGVRVRGFAARAGRAIATGFNCGPRTMLSVPRRLRRALRSTRGSRSRAGSPIIMSGCGS